MKHAQVQTDPEIFTFIFNQKRYPAPRRLIKDIIRERRKDVPVPDLKNSSEILVSYLDDATPLKIDVDIVTTFHISAQKYREIMESRHVTVSLTGHEPGEGE
jgi:hypothetical protein